MEDINLPTVAAAATPARSDEKRQLREEQAYGVLGYTFSNKKKWLILTTVFIVQLSMNFNAAIYANAVPGMMEEFGIDHKMASVGQMIFLVAYAFGCEFWAPFSEELGRKWILQGSLLLVNIWQIPCALASNFSTVMAFRALMGLSSAGGSVTLGMIADMWEPEDQQFAVAYVVLSSVAGSVIAPIFGGFITAYLDWPWVFWISLIFGVVAQALHLFITPETRSDVLLDRHARKLRESGENKNVYGPNEIKGTFFQRLHWKECLKLMWRPYSFMYTEPIVLFLSLLSGFSDALIFAGLDSYPLVLAKWSFTTIAIGLAFIPLLIGYLIAYGSFLLRYKSDRRTMRTNPDSYPPERRLWLLLFLVILEPVGLFFYGLSSYFAPDVHWIAPMICSMLIGIANFAIYMATIDYMIAAYGPFAASATGSNGFFRDFLAGIAALYTRPMYGNIKPGTRLQFAIPAWILTVIGALLCIPVFVFYFKGAWFRERSTYAQQLDRERVERRAEREVAIQRESPPTTPTSSRPSSRPASRPQSPTRVGSSSNSPNAGDLRARLNGLSQSPTEQATDSIELKAFA